MFHGQEQKGLSLSSERIPKEYEKLFNPLSKKEFEELDIKKIKKEFLRESFHMNIKDHELVPFVHNIINLKKQFIHDKKFNDVLYVAALLIISSFFNFSKNINYENGKDFLLNMISFWFYKHGENSIFSYYEADKPKKPDEYGKVFDKGFLPDPDGD